MYVRMYTVRMHIARIDPGLFASRYKNIYTSIHALVMELENSVVVAPFTVFGWFGMGLKWSYIEPFWSQTGLLLKLHTLSYDCHVTLSHCNWSLQLATAL